MNYCYNNGEVSEMRIIIQEDRNDVGKWAAQYVARKINAFAPTEKRPFVLGLPTGSTPLKMYQELIKMCELGKVSFQYVITFNMDEYVGLEPTHEQSYHYFMAENFFNHIDIQEKNIHILDGMADDLEQECRNFEKKIIEVGGIDLFIGGVGIDGHIAFNEPGSSLTSRTRDKELREETRQANARFFGGDVNKVPQLALTVGVGTIMDAKQVLILADGKNKAEAIHHAVEGSINHLWTVSMLQMHPKALFVIDNEAAELLSVRTYRYFLDVEKDNLQIDEVK